MTVQQYYYRVDMHKDIYKGTIYKSTIYIKKR